VNGGFRRGRARGLIRSVPPRAVAKELVPALQRYDKDADQHQQGRKQKDKNPAPQGLLASYISGRSVVVTHGAALGKGDAGGE
jgi:hypothetical protein